MLFSESRLLHSSMRNAGVCVGGHSVISNSLQPHGLTPTRFLCPWNFPGKNTGVGCHFLLQGNLPHPGTESKFLASPALAGGFLNSRVTTEAPRKAGM